MTALWAITTGLSFWLIAWALGIKGFDAFMVAIFIFLLAAGWQAIRPYLPGNRADAEEPRSGGTWLSK